MTKYRSFNPAQLAGFFCAMIKNDLTKYTEKFFEKQIMLFR